MSPCLSLYSTSRLNPDIGLRRVATILVESHSVLLRQGGTPTIISPRELVRWHSRPCYHAYWIQDTSPQASTSTVSAQALVPF